MNVIMVCLGNICRSPMAEFVMKQEMPSWDVESRATSTWEHGNPIHQGTQAILQKYQIPYDLSKQSQQISQKDFLEADLILAMDRSNLEDLRAMAPQEALDKIHPLIDGEVPDPWYTGDFEETYRLVRQGCQEWKEKVGEL